MKTFVCYAYWSLLAVSLLSSCLLFIIVASETVKEKAKSNENTEQNHKAEEVHKQKKYIPVKLKKSFFDTTNIPFHNTDEHSGDDRPDLNDIVFLETLSKNSGVTSNGISEMPTSQSVLTFIDKTKDLRIETSLEENLDNIINNQSNKIDTKNSIDLDISDDKKYLNNAIEDKMENDKEDEGAIEEEQKIIFKNISPNDEILSNDHDNIAENLNDTKMLVTDNLVPEVNLTVEENQIPVFSEWAQKHMEEAEKMKQGASLSNSQKKNTTSGSKLPTVKQRAKNYASPDCGAKIIASNPEAGSTGSVLTGSKDEYMLSPCRSRIWFVVELCEPIQAEKVQLANFELFSSSPKEFSVSVSNRFPTRDWSLVGQFTAKDERDVQNFELFPHLFGKFVKVEIQSHYSSEHYCPISLFRVYGVSEFEAFETENQPIDDDIDDDVNLEDENVNGKRKDNQNNNLLKSASDAVMSIVKKAAEALTKSNDHLNETNLNKVNLEASKKLTDCFTPSYMIKCDQCTEQLYSDVSELLSCKYKYLLKLLSLKLVKHNIYNSKICANIVGVDLVNYISLDHNNNYSIDNNNYKLNDLNNDYISHLLPIRYIAAMCNIIAATHKKLGLNTNFDKDNNNNDDDENKETLSNLTIDQDIINNNININNDVNKILQSEIVFENGEKKINKDILYERKFPIDNTIINLESCENEIQLLSEKFEKDNTAPEIDLENFNDIIIEPTKSVSEAPEVSTQIPPPPLLKDDKNDENIIIELNNNNNDSSEEPHTVSSLDTQERIDILQSQTIISDVTTTLEAGGGNNNWDGLDILSEANNPEGNQNGNYATAPQANQKVQTESVFLRLSNRIKSLERNMSLSGQYLEELSRRYKKQVEELQNSFAKTLLSIEEQNRRSLERELELVAQNTNLKRDFNNLLERIDSWTNIGMYVGGFLSIQLIVLCTLLRLCTRKQKQQQTNQNNINNSKKNRKQNLKTLNRRKSLEDIGQQHGIALIRKRRPSEEALYICGGTYSDLLISDENIISTITTQSYNGIDDEILVDNKAYPKIKNRKNSLQNHQKRALSEEPSKEKVKVQLFRHESAPGTYNKKEEIKPNIINNKITILNDTTLLEENDEFYMPGTDLAYNEFMPDGPSGQQYINISSENRNHVLKKQQKVKTRRLSSPGFLKSAISSSKKSHEEATGWEWYKLKKSSSQTSQQDKERKRKKSKSESPETIQSTNNVNGFINLQKIHKNEETNLKKNILPPNNSTVVSASSNSERKSGSIRKLFKKVF